MFILRSFSPSVVLVSLREWTAAVRAIWWSSSREPPTDNYVHRCRRVGANVFDFLPIQPIPCTTCPYPAPPTPSGLARPARGTPTPRARPIRHTAVVPLLAYLAASPPKPGAFLKNPAPFRHQLQPEPSAAWSAGQIPICLTHSCHRPVLDRCPILSSSCESRSGAGSDLTNRPSSSVAFYQHSKPRPNVVPSDQIVADAPNCPFFSMPLHDPPLTHPVADGARRTDLAARRQRSLAAGLW